MILKSSALTKMIRLALKGRFLNTIVRFFCTVARIDQSSATSNNRTISQPLQAAWPEPYADIERNMSHKNKIIIHCSATKPSMDIGVKEIRDWHVNDNGWSDIGYNAVIRRDGTFEPGRCVDGDWTISNGAHAKGFNTDSIGICLIGGMAEDGSNSANFTADQYFTLYDTVETLARTYGIKEILGHCDLPGVTKTCPNFDVKSFFENPEW